MQADAETAAWLRTELVSALGFAEVDEIASYITSSFSSKDEVASYLIELLGIPAGRAETISERLFSSTRPATRGKTAAAASTEGLVPRPTAVNSRLKPSRGKSHAGGKNKKMALLNNALIINCLRCGKIEYNGGRRCSFCDSELHYEEAPGALVGDDGAAQQHMEKLVQLDESGAERTRVIDTEQFFYDEQEARTHTNDVGGRRPITLALDLDNKRFVDAPMRTIARNEQLPKDARDVFDGVQRKMGKNRRRTGNSSNSGSNQGLSSAVVVVDDAYNLLFV